jgi:hypothetical protein
LLLCFFLLDAPRGISLPSGPSVTQAPDDHKRVFGD